MNFMPKSTTTGTAFPAIAIPAFAAVPTRQRAPDPLFAAIDNFWDSYSNYQKAKNRKARFYNRLDKEITRSPRVQYGWLLKGRDNTGNEIKEPIYRHSDYEIDRAINENLRAYQAMAGKNKDARRNLSKQFARRRTELKNALKADAADLERRQHECGYWEAVHGEEKASTAFYQARYDAFHSRPTTSEGALAGLQFIQRVCRFELRTNQDNFSPGEGYISTLVGNCWKTLAVKGRSAH